MRTDEYVVSEGAVTYPGVIRGLQGNPFHSHWKEVLPDRTVDMSCLRYLLYLRTLAVCVAIGTVFATL